MSQAFSASSDFCTSTKGANPAGGQPPFPSFLLLARPPYATSLRLCVGPALQVSQAPPRGGAESDFSALELDI
jgi:hypothetical protein